MIHEGTELTLPTTSNNGITGVWSPQFDPNGDTVTVIPFTNPEFNQIDDTCVQPANYIK